PIAGPASAVKCGRTGSLPLAPRSPGDPLSGICRCNVPAISTLSHPVGIDRKIDNINSLAAVFPIRHEKLSRHESQGKRTRPEEKVPVRGDDLAPIPVSTAGTPLEFMRRR